MSAGQPLDLADAMADEDDRYREGVAHFLDIAKNVEPARIVERRQRLVQQQQARTDQQGATDRHALLFAARQPVRPSRQQRVEAEQRGHCAEVDEALAPPA